MGRPFAVGHEAGAHMVCSREVKALDIAMSCMPQDRMLLSLPRYSFGFSLSEQARRWTASSAEFGRRVD